MSTTFTCPEHGDRAIYADGEAVCMSKPRTAVIPGTINGQTHTEARRLYQQAESSEVQAAIYTDMAEAIASLESDWDQDPLWAEIRDQQVARLEQLATEMYDDADDRRGRIETEWIDYL